MFKHASLSVATAALFFYSPYLLAASDADLTAIRAEIAQLKQSYEQRIAELEQRGSGLKTPLTMPPRVA